jgi:hypothetical protein
MYVTVKFVIVGVPGGVITAAMPRIAEEPPGLLAAMPAAYAVFDDKLNVYDVPATAPLHNELFKYTA